MPKETTITALGALPRVIGREYTQESYDPIARLLTIKWQRFLICEADVEAYDACFALGGLEAVQAMYRGQK